MDIVKGIITIIVICFVAMVIFFFISPPPNPHLYHRLTVDTHGIDIYYLTVTSNAGTNSYTFVDETFSEVLTHGEYYLEACYWNVNNTKKCESQRIWLDEDITIDFFMDVIE